jgi:hypothetical protein
MKSLIILLIAAISFPNAIEASMKYERMDSNGWCSRGSKPKAPSPGYACYKFVETNDGDPSVIFDGRKIKSLESKKSLKPIYWAGNGAYHYNYLTLYLSEISINYLDNVARQERGLKKLKWKNRTYKLTNKGRWDKFIW